MFGAVQTHMRDMPEDIQTFTSNYYKTFYCHAKRRVRNTRLRAAYSQNNTLQSYIYLFQKT